MHHHHHHGAGRVLKVSTFVTVGFVVVQVWAGLTADSLALLSDAGHNFTDALALVLAAFGVYLQRKPADESRTFGYHRGGVLAALFNALSLIVLSLYIFWESWHRLQNPQAVAENIMIVTAGLGLIVNCGILIALNRAGRHDLNIRAAAMHMLGDALGSIAIIIGAVAIHYTGWQAIDPVLSVLIGLLIIWTALDVVRESLNILLEGLPRGIALRAVVDELRAVPGVIDVHDVHIWSLGSSTHALSCHALIENMPPSESDSILGRMNDVLAERFHIHHSTIQFEHVRCELSEGGCSMRSHHSHGHTHAH